MTSASESASERACELTGGRAASANADDERRRVSHVSRLEAVCVSGPDLLPLPGRKPDRSGIDKKPVRGRVAVHPLGLDGDVQVNRKHHGGEGQAVYACAQEDAEWWADEVGRELPPGRFGENLRTSGLDLTGALLGERWRIGTALFEVAGDRASRAPTSSASGACRGWSSGSPGTAPAGPTCGSSSPGTSAPAISSRWSTGPVTASRSGSPSAP